jgi:hypothetical protein
VRLAVGFKTGTTVAERLKDSYESHFLGLQISALGTDP